VIAGGRLLYVNMILKKDNMDKKGEQTVRPFEYNCSGQETGGINGR
jgi:hypothetical protein